MVRRCHYPRRTEKCWSERKGQLSGVIKSSVGFLIVRLDDIQPAKVKSLDEVRDDVAAKVNTKKPSMRTMRCSRK
ncbi:peptidyl-prolyl cis-trans isomerase [Shigella flexneri]